MNVPTHAALTAASLILACGLAAQSFPPQEGTKPLTDAELLRNYDYIPPDAGITWKDITKSGGSIRFYGFTRLDYYYQTARANSVLVPAWVLPEDGVYAKDNDNDNAFDARLTRFGFEIGGTDIGGATISGKLETDFANYTGGSNNSTESRETPRIRLAYTDIVFHDSAWKLRLGQDWDVIAPLYPAVNAELLQWNAGNLGDRRPMAQAIWHCKNESTAYKFTLAAGMTGAVDNANVENSTVLPVGFVNERDGFDSGNPHVQTRLGYKCNTWAEGRQMEIGAWGFWGRLETDSPIGTSGDRRFSSWLAGGDWTIPITDTITFRGEAWLGEALSDMRGGVGQSINTVTGEEIASRGGFAELWWQASEKVRFHVGGSIDDPKRGDLSVGGGPPALPARDRNEVGYLGTLITWHPRFKTGLDVLYWNTDWVGTKDGDMIRVDAFVMYTF
jgi:hypothetical protein